jgi:exodeoxyribonuclease-3
MAPAAVRIATWNVNSVKARLDHLVRWLRDAAPDVVLLQETKATDETFPRAALEDLGYNIACAGQRTYNGVAILSRRPLDVLSTALPGDASDAQARYLEAFTFDVRVASIYAPNGNPTDGEKFRYKLAWLQRLHAHARTLLASEDAFVLGGDFNVAPDDVDVYDPVGWSGDALCRPESRAALRQTLHLGLTDAVRAILPAPARAFTWWDYRAGAWAADNGLRIDHVLLSPQAADRLLDAGIDRSPRGWEKPSDHTPVWVRLSTTER